MKRHDLERRLRMAGCLTWHNEIKEPLARKILANLGAN